MFLSLSVPVRRSPMSKLQIPRTVLGGAATAMDPLEAVVFAVLFLSLSAGTGGDCVGPVAEQSYTVTVCQSNSSNTSFSSTNTGIVSF